MVGSPLKLYEYAAAGLQVVGTAIDGVTDSPVAEIVHTYTAGDVASCAHAIMRALASPGVTPHPSTWTWEARARDLLHQIRELG